MNETLTISDLYVSEKPIWRRDLTIRWANACPDGPTGRAEQLGSPPRAMGYEVTAGRIGLTAWI